MERVEGMLGTMSKPVDRDELLTALLLERFGGPVPEFHPDPRDDSDSTWQRLRLLHEHAWDFTDHERTNG